MCTTKYTFKYEHINNVGQLKKHKTEGTIRWDEKLLQNCMYDARNKVRHYMQLIQYYISPHYTPDDVLLFKIK